jgi:outer membrane protein assembly factor BamB
MVPSWSRRLLLWLALGLIVVFLGMAAYQRFYADRLRFVPDADLMEELDSATLQEEPLTGLDNKAWSGWFGPRRDGTTSAPNLLVDWPSGGPKSLWSGPIGEGYSSFAVVDGAAYSMLSTTDGKEAVVCWDTANGKERWRHEYSPGPTFQYGGPRATPTLSGNRLFILSSSGVLMCLDTSNGKVIWERDLLQLIGAAPPRWGFACSPLVEGDRVFVAAGGSDNRCLAAFDKEGKQLWTSQNDPAGYSSPIAVTINKVRQIVFFTGRRLLGVTPEEGKLLWEFPWQTDFEVNAATPLVIRGRNAKTKEELTYLFISSGYGKGCALVKIITEGGGFRANPVYASNELCCHFASPVRHREHVYGLDEKRDLTCLSLRTGKVAWRRRGFQKGSLIRVDDRLIVLGENGNLALLEANPNDYVELARARPFRDRCWTLPVLAGGRLFLRDQKKVLCLNLRNR